VKLPSYFQFIVEKLGVPDDIKPMAKVLARIALDAAKKQFPPQFLGMTVEPFHKAVKVPKTDRLPVEAVELISYCRLLSDEVKTGMADDVPFVEGEFAGLYNGEHGLTIRMKLLPAAKMEFLTKPNWEKLLLPHIEAAAMHELTHAFEAYQRRSHGVGMFNLSSRSIYDAAGMSFGQVEPVIPPSLRDFFFIMYLCASYEVNARVAQIEPYLRSKRSNSSKLEAIKSTEMWKHAQRMLSFSADQTMKSLISDYGSEKDVEEEMNKFKAWLGETASRTTKFFLFNEDEPFSMEERQEMIRFFRNHDWQQILTMSHRTTRQMLNYWEKKAHMQGEELRRKLLRTIAR